MVIVAGAILGVIVVNNVFAEAHRVIGWAVAAGIVALLLDPVIDRLDRLLPRVLALASTFVVIIAIGAGIAALYTTSLRDEADRLVEAVPAIVSDVESREDRLADLTQEFRVAERVDELMTRLDDAVGTGSDTIRSAALSAPAFFVSMILTIFFLVFGRRMVAGGLGQLSAERRARLGPALASSVSRSQRYIWSALAQSAAVGAVTTVLALWLDVPGPALFGLFGAIAALVPYLGILVGTLPLLLIGLGVSPGWKVGIAAAVMVAVTVVETAWWLPRVHRRSLYVGPAIPLVVAILGYAVYGVGGALYSMAISVFALALIDEFDVSGDDLPTPLDDYGDDDGAGAGADVSIV